MEQKKLSPREAIELANKIFIGKKRINIMDRSLLWFITEIIGGIVFILSFGFLGNKRFILGGFLFIIGLILFIYSFKQHRFYEKTLALIGTKEGEENFDKVLPNYRETWINNYLTSGGKLNKLYYK